MVRHYRTKRLVDVHCADEPTHSDYMTWLQRRNEDRRHAEQTVPFQGEQPVPPGQWYAKSWYVSDWRVA